MTVSEKATKLVAAAKATMEAMKSAGDDYSRATIGAGMSLEVVTEFAAQLGVKIRETVWVGCGPGYVLFSADYEFGRATVGIQGSRPATAEDVRRLGGASISRETLDLDAERAAAVLSSSQAEVAP